MTRIHALRTALRTALGTVLSISVLGTALGTVLLLGSAHAQDGSKPEARNMRLAGYSDLQARTAYQPTIQKQGDKWIAYIGHHGDQKVNPLNGRVEHNGTSIIDVTDVKNPKYLFHIPGEEGKAEQGGAQMVRICSM